MRSRARRRLGCGRHQPEEVHKGAGSMRLVGGLTGETERERVQPRIPEWPEWTGGPPAREAG